MNPLAEEPIKHHLRLSFKRCRDEQPSDEALEPLVQSMFEYIQTVLNQTEKP